MPVFVASLIGGLMSAGSSIVGWVMIAMGVGIASYTGVDLALGEFKSMILNGGQSLPASVVGMLGYMNIGKGINILFSACVIRFTMQGLMGGAIKRWVLK